MFEIFVELFARLLFPFDRRKNTAKSLEVIKGNNFKDLAQFYVCVLPTCMYVYEVCTGSPRNGVGHD